MLCATFRLRSSLNKGNEKWLVAKKRGELTTQDAADGCNEKFGGVDIWACDIEDFKKADLEEKQKAYEEIDNTRKLFL